MTQTFAAGHEKTQTKSQGVAEALGIQDPKASWKNCRNRLEDLLSAFKSDEMALMCASGTEKEYEEREQLLTEVKKLVEEAVGKKAVKNSMKSKDIKKREVNRAALCAAAVSCLSDKFKTPKKPPNSSDNKNRSLDSELAPPSSFS
ncbi:hypothetical protein BCR33DRAFT_750982 [Rhizoclosmatium globosum]|uniref:Uncharacterized protein n=1 Tax=Rhizoclosmatium globosum TaxID=329046 RepID=A0A1Y2A8T8_9FUNG|nr:hypothetical protein BCR33DRAFT_750982 [Rhizoclosmatium globosum]|eukprot:ORY18894.1 hypothetical protein BCR33DRAFT_750982 [Rhizoclosmatium globosum]